MKSFIPVLSNGLGVESTCILLRWLEEPAVRDFDLEDLIVITAMTGTEWPDTRRDFEAHVLPRLRQHGVRFVQVARSGHFEGDGITILDDSRCPDKLHADGAYKLMDELLQAGTGNAANSTFLKLRELTGRNLPAHSVPSPSLVQISSSASLTIHRKPLTP